MWGQERKDTILINSFYCKDVSHLLCTLLWVIVWQDTTNTKYNVAIIKTWYNYITVVLEIVVSFCLSYSMKHYIYLGNNVHIQLSLIKQDGWLTIFTSVLKVLPECREKHSSNHQGKQYSICCTTNAQQILKLWLHFLSSLLENTTCTQHIVLYVNWSMISVYSFQYFQIIRISLIPQFCQWDVWLVSHSFSMTAIAKIEPESYRTIFSDSMFCSKSTEELWREVIALYFDSILNFSA